jgi:hypothetical protein
MLHMLIMFMDAAVVTAQKNPLLDLLVIFLFASSLRYASSCIFHLACFCQSQNYLE